MIRIACIAGARPNFMKVAALVRAFQPHFAASLIHTDQHYSPEMSQVFFTDLDLPEPDLHLGVNGGTGTQQTAAIMQRLEPAFLSLRPDLVAVVGDVNSTLAAALVASKLRIPLAHIEAGLRSFDRAMPEETNRIVTDALSDYLFVSEPSGLANLRAEGVAPAKVFHVGNVMIDTLLRARQRAAASSILRNLGLAPRSYAVVTIHRPSNADEPARLEALVGALSRLAFHIPVVFPVHPRTRTQMAGWPIHTDRLILTPPLGYLDFVHLMGSARLVLTDSGGIQEETTVLGIPCLTLRDNTERPVTVEEGTNRLVGTDPERLLQCAFQALDSPMPPAPRIPALWDGHAAERIAAILAGQLSCWPHTAAVLPALSPSRRPFAPVLT